MLATHDGTVKSVTDGIVTVEMHVLSACASCKAHEKCAFVDKADKIVEIETSDWKHYHEGDSVIVSINESLGLLAVLLAYVLPALLLIATLVLSIHLWGSELVASILTLILLAIYFTILYLCRDKLQRHFSFGLTKEIA